VTLAAKNYVKMVSTGLDIPMFVERKVFHSALFTNLVRWHTGAVSFPQVTSFLLGLPAP